MSYSNICGGRKFKSFDENGGFWTGKFFLPFQVHDGDSEAGNLLAELSGQSAGEVFVSTMSNLHIVFQSNAGGSGQGFIAYYSQV
jgi:hypothetical protein